MAPRKDGDFYYTKNMKRFWTKKEVDDLTRLYPDTETGQLSAYFDRSKAQIRDKAFVQGLKKSHECLSRAAKSGNLADYGEKNRFKKGQKSWNTKPIGHISIRNDPSGNKYQMIKIKGEKRLVMLHRHLWIKENGEIPPGKILRFKDGNTLNCDLSNLELIDRRQHMEKNTFLNYPKDAMEVIHAKRVLTRIINQKSGQL